MQSVLVFKLQKAFPDVQMNKQSGKLFVERRAGDLLSRENEGQYALSPDAEKIVQSAVGKYGEYTPARLKTVVYMTVPMRAILKREKNDSPNMYNVPLLSIQ